MQRRKFNIKRSIEHVLYEVVNTQWGCEGVIVCLACDVDCGMGSNYIPIANGYMEVVYPNAVFERRILKYGPALEVQLWANSKNLSIGVMLPPQGEVLTISLPY